MTTPFLDLVCPSKIGGRGKYHNGTIYLDDSYQNGFHTIGSAFGLAIWFVGFSLLVNCFHVQSRL